MLLCVRVECDATKRPEFRVQPWSDGGCGGRAGGGCLDLQLGELLAELPGVGSDPADGVVAEVELL